MQTNEIAQLIAHPSTIAPGYKSDLKELVVRYPFSQTLALLYLKSIAIENDVHFDSELGAHAFRITSREHLYELIHANSDASVLEIKNSPEISLEDQEAELVQLPKLIPVVEEIAEPILTETSGVEEKFETIEPIQNVDALVFVDEIRATEVSLNEVSEIEKIEIDVALKDGLDLDILAHAINNAAEIILEEKEENVLRQYETKQEDSTVLPNKQSFTAWLHASTKPLENKKEIAKVEKDDRSRAIIDNFIETEPKITRSFDKETPEKVKKSFYTPQHAAKESVNEENLIMTETLAKIYVLQGNFPMAIKAYTQLQLLIPEKKSFFAIQIKELTTKISL